MTGLTDAVIRGVLEFVRKPSPVVAVVICFCLWIWLDHCDKRYLVETVHSDLVQIQLAIEKNSGKVDSLGFQISQLERH